MAGTGNQEALWQNGGVFTRKLIDALDGDADYFGIGVMTANQVSDYVRKRVADHSAQSGHRQDPDYQKLDIVGRGEMVFIPQASGHSSATK